MTNIIFFELSALTQGVPFDGLTHGEFMDAFLRPVKIKKADLKKFYDNTLANLEGTETESGEVVGLPIDIKGHDKEDAAGWIVGASLEDGVLRLIAKWTDLGVDAIKRGIRRYFSATLDMKNKVILGGTLTNWPATRDSKGKILLRPVELTQGAFRIELEDSLDARATRVRSAWLGEFADSAVNVSTPGMSYPLEIYDDFLIVEEGGDHFQVGYSVDDDDEISFAAKDTWKPVERKWVEAMRAAIGSFFNNLFTSEESATDAGKGDKTNDEGVLSMDITKEELKEFVATTVKDEIAAGIVELNANQLPPVEGETDETIPAQNQEAAVASLIELLELGEINDEVQTAVLDQTKVIFGEMQGAANRQAMEMIAGMQHTSNVREFCTQVVSGTAEIPHGFQMDAKLLEEFMLSLPKAQAVELQGILEGIWKAGFMEFAELGSNLPEGGAQELPAEYVAKLDAGELTVDQLRENSTLLGLGDLDTFDLAKWQK